MTVYLVVLLSVLNSIGQRGSKVAVSLYALELGGGPFTVGLLAAMFAAFPLLLAVHAGRISDRVGVRYPILLGTATRSEEHTSELQSRSDLVCRLLLEKKKKNKKNRHT